MKPCSSAAAPRRCWAATGWPTCSTRSATHFTLAARRRGDHRGEPGVDVAGVLRRSARRRLHPGVAGHAVGRTARAGRARPGALAGPSARGRRRGRAAGVRRTSTSTSSTARRGRPTTTCAARSTPRSRPGSTTCRRTRWSSRTAPRWPGGCGAVRSPRPTTTCSPHATSCSTRGCREAGFDWYEVSNWSRPGAECRHNLGYWNGGQWWGAGPGAHGYVGDTRWWNVKHPNAYAQASPTDGCRSPTSRSSTSPTGTPRT